jgi:hexosaminidase
MNALKRSITLVSISAWAATCMANSPAIIPAPAHIERQDGQTTITAETVIVAPQSLALQARQLQEMLKPATGFNLVIRKTSNTPSTLRLTLVHKLVELGSEGYQLNSTPTGTEILAATPTGIFYGIQSLRQLLPPEIASPTQVSGVKWSLPCVSISDQPRFSWRAFMLDEARYFKGEKEVKKLLDQMAELKMNVFHWHLTDDQGWRIEIKKYPKLTSIGSSRTDSQIGGWNSPKRSGKPHSGFYTQEQIKEIVAYAQARQITIIPEIGMPGHACAAIAAYPELGTLKKKIEVMTRFGKGVDTYDPSSEIVYTMLSDILDEVVALFPSKIIHIGGDEVRFNQWEKSQSIRKLMKKKHLATMPDVQIYFTNRMADIVEAKGRNIMGWNEILGDDLHGFLKDGQATKTGTLDPDTIVQFWKGNPSLAKRAIKNGYKIVNSWHSFTYLDYSYGSISLAKAYNFDPIFSGLTPAEEKKIIGIGCQMWGEWIPTVKRMEAKVYPRLAAYAEVGWTTKANKNLSSFQQRLKSQFKRWDLQKINYAKNQVKKLSAQDYFNYVRVARWNPKKTPATWKEVEFPTAGKISEAGKYEVVFLYTKGQAGLEISGVRLLENGKTVATDKHKGFSGKNLNKVAYRFKLSKFNPEAVYTIVAHIKGSGGTDSRGEIKIKAGE